MTANISLEAAGQWGDAPAAPWSYSDEANLKYFTSSAGMHTFKITGFICPEKVQGTQLWRVLSSLQSRIYHVLYFT